LVNVRPVVAHQRQPEESVKEVFDTC